jgi:hypothetical protein
LSNYARGNNDAKWASTLEKLANGLGMPPRLRQAMGLTGDVTRTGPRPGAVAVAGVPADSFDVQLLAEAMGRNGTNVKRRDVLALAGQLGAAAALAQTEAWERLAHALARPGPVDETVVRQMEARSAGFYLLEDIAPAQAVLRALTVHLREVGTLLHAGANDPGDDLRRRLIVAAGEASLLAGWSASALPAGHWPGGVATACRKASALRAHQSLKVAGLRPSRRWTVSVRSPVVSARMRVIASRKASASAGGAPLGKRARTASSGVAGSRTLMSRPVAVERIRTCSATVSASSPVRTYSLPWWPSLVRARAATAAMSAGSTGA